MANEEAGQVLIDAIAEYFECDPAEITGYVIGVERNTENGATLSSVWSSSTPLWTLLGFAEELRKHLEKQRDRLGGDVMEENGKANVPSRAQRRSRGSRRR